MSTGYVLIHCNDSYRHDVIKQLKEINTITDIQGISGIYDVIVKVKTNDTRVLTEIINKQIRKIDKIKSTLTLIIAKSEC